MDFDSPEVEKDFPGLYASDGSRKDEPLEADQKGRRKEKKDKKCYATLEGEESADETGAKSSKSKKLKAFKFSSKSKEKREKSRDKEKPDKEAKKDKKKDGQQSLADAQPIFGVALSDAVARHPCHDEINLPLVVRNCLDYLQEHLSSDQIHKSDGVKTRMQQLKKLYNAREFTQDFEDVQTASALLRLFIKELPEPILTNDLLPRFEEAASLSSSTEQEQEILKLIEQLPTCNQTLLKWLLLHLDAVTQNEKSNKLNAQSLAVLLSPNLQMSHRLLGTLLCFASDLFADYMLTRYVPPLTSSALSLPETREEIQKELRKQESLLAQIHAEIHAGYVSKKREEQLWDVQRIITQLKRKLRAFEKKPEKSVDEAAPPEVTSDGAAVAATIDLTLQKPSDDENSSVKTMTLESSDTKTTPHETPDEHSAASEEPRKDVFLLTDAESGLLMLPSSHPDHSTLLRLQLENAELVNWKNQLQARIRAERAEVVRLKKLLAETPPVPLRTDLAMDPLEYERLVAHLVKENTLLEQRKTLLARDIFEENRALVQLQVELAMQKLKI